MLGTDVALTEKDKAEFIALTPQQQKEVILGLQLLERDGVISPPISHLYLIELEPESGAEQ